jgi:hypothetical protein
MKNIINKSLLAILGCAAIFTSVKKILEEYNPSGLTSATVYTKAAGLKHWLVPHILILVFGMARRS